MSNKKEAFLKFVEDMTSGKMGRDNEEVARDNRAMAEKLKEFDPHLTSLVVKWADAQLEVVRYLRERAER